MRISLTIIVLLAPFVVVPLVCAFFIDLVNALLIPFFLTNF